MALQSRHECCQELGMSLGNQTVTTYEDKQDERDMQQATGDR